MTRYYCEDMADDERFHLVFGKAAEIRRLYRRLGKNGVTPEFLGEPKYNPDRTYGIMISYDEHGYPWMRVLGNEGVLSILAGMADGSFDQIVYYC